MCPLTSLHYEQFFDGPMIVTVVLTDVQSCELILSFRKVKY